MSADASWRMTLADAWSGVRSHPARLILAVGTMATGVAALAMLLGLLRGLDQRADRLVHEFGADSLALLPADPARPSGTIPPDVRAQLRSSLPDVTVSGMRLFPHQVLDSGAVINLIAADETLAQARGWRVTEGRGLDAADVQRANRVCLITHGLSAELQSGIGQAVALQGVPFTVVGIVAASGATGDLDPRLQPGDRFMLVPDSVPPLWLQTEEPPAAGVDMLFVRTRAPERVASVLAEAQRVIGPEAGRSYAWLTPDTLLAGIRSLRATLSFTIGAIAGLCLLLGGATLAGLMMTRVQERVPEIGLRRALGASRADIAALFLAEALLVSAGASAVGLTGCLAMLTVLGSRPLPAPVLLGLWEVTVPVGVSIVTAVVASLGPAIAAARISPYEALRNE